MSAVGTPVGGAGQSAAGERHAPLEARLRGLDGLRGAAVLSVVAFHTLRIKEDHGVLGVLWASVQESTWAGVDLFFVLSGFLITGILLDSRDTHRYFINFYARRILRIFPLYYAVLIVALLILPALLGMGRLPALYSRLLENQVWLWTYLANFLQAREAHTLPGFGHFWSLAVEEQFYWFWPLAIFFTSRRILLKACLAVCFLLPAVRLVLLLHGFSPWALRQCTFTRFDTLLFGALAALIVRDPVLIRICRVVLPIAACVALIGLLSIELRSGFIPYEGAETMVWGYSAFGIIFGTIIFRVAMQGPEFRGLLSAATLGWFGKYSYGIYIFHWPIAQAVQGLADRALVSFHSEFLTAFFRFVCVLAISSAAAWLSWHFFEVHFLRLKRYFEYSRSAPQPSNDSSVISSPVLEPGAPGLSMRPRLESPHEKS